VREAIPDKNSLSGFFNINIILLTSVHDFSEDSAKKYEKVPVGYNYNAG
jgi:hypothetical protein